MDLQLLVDIGLIGAVIVAWGLAIRAAMKRKGQPTEPPEQI